MARNIHFQFDIKMTKKNSRTVPIKFFDDAGQPQDCSTWDFLYTAKESLEDDDADALIRLDPADLPAVDGGTGTLNLVYIVITDTLSNIAARDYFHDLKVVVGSVSSTYFMGTLTIEDGVTDRTAALAP